MKFRIYYDDTDAQGIVYHANFLKFCERARSEIFFSRGVLFSPDSHFVVSRVEADFLKPAFLGDELEVISKVSELKRASIVLLQEIFRGEECIFRAKVTAVYLKNKKIAKIEGEILKTIQNLG